MRMVGGTEYARPIITERQVPVWRPSAVLPTTRLMLVEKGLFTAQARLAARFSRLGRATDFRGHSRCGLFARKCPRGRAHRRLYLAGLQ